MNRKDWWIAAALFVVSTLVRIPLRSHGLFHGDSYGLAAGAMYTLTAHPPGFIGYCTLVRIAYLFCGDLNLGFVIVNILSTGLATALTFILGRTMFDRRAGVIAAVLYATSLDVSYFADVALSYAAEGAFATAAGLTAWLAVQRRSSRWLVAHSAILAIGGSVRQTTVAFLFPLWMYVMWKAVSKAEGGRQKAEEDTEGQPSRSGGLFSAFRLLPSAFVARALAALTFIVIVYAWSVPNAHRLAKYWDKSNISYLESVYRLQVAMEQYYDSAQFGKVSYEPTVARFHWPLVELGVAVWNKVHPPPPDARVEVRSASASNALRMLRYQTAKLLFYLAVALGLATIFVLLAFLKRVRTSLDRERWIVLFLWVVPAAGFFAVNHLGAWGYLLIFLAALCALAARAIAILFERRAVTVTAAIALVNVGVFLFMRPLPDTTERNQLINIALLQYGAPSIRAGYARARSSAFRSDPRQLALDCVTDECLEKTIPEDFGLPKDLRPVRPFFGE